MCFLPHAFSSYFHIPIHGLWCDLYLMMFKRLCLSCYAFSIGLVWFTINDGIQYYTIRYHVVRHFKIFLPFDWAEILFIFDSFHIQCTLLALMISEPTNVMPIRLGFYSPQSLQYVDIFLMAGLSFEPNHSFLIRSSISFQCFDMAELLQLTSYITQLLLLSPWKATSSYSSYLPLENFLHFDTKRLDIGDISTCPFLFYLRDYTYFSSNYNRTQCLGQRYPRSLFMFWTLMIIIDPPGRLAEVFRLA